MVRSAITSLVCLAALMSGCAATARQSSPTEGTSPAAHVQLLTIELRDHPDPHTGALRVIDGARPWPLELGALLDAVSHDWAPTSVYDVRRARLAAGVIEQTEETTVRVLESNRNSARLSIKLDAAAQPIEVTVPINSTVVVGSEAGGQRHAFVALSLLDRTTRMRIPEVFSTREPGIVPPLQLDHSPLAAPESARANGQKGVLLDVEIDERGNVIRAHVLGHRFLSDTEIAAIEKTVSGWKFKPGTANGKAVRVVTTITSVFREP
ncbi:MAG TPA: energy transducer TonB [Thermoanaerobaculia bacterium]|nr:energy transducer TonB [Thermoanaerobaculia bacterium]